jgi:hypothetical protein
MPRATNTIKRSVKISTGETNLNVVSQEACIPMIAMKVNGVACINIGARTTTNALARIGFEMWVRERGYFNSIGIGAMSIAHR